MGGMGRMGRMRRGEPQRGGGATNFMFLVLAADKLLEE